MWHNSILVSKVRSLQPIQGGSSKLGDIGSISLSAANGGTEILAQTDELYVGSHPSSQFKKGIAGIAASITHTFAKVCGFSPGAGRMKKFQTGLGSKVSRRLAKTRS